VQGDPSLAFVVVEPFFVDPRYQPDINPRDAESLGIEHPEDAILLNIVNLQGQKFPTVNLKGPIVINRQTMTGRQIIPENAAQYSIKNPLPLQ
jgi:flagellar assembly factor FliW